MDAYYFQLHISIDNLASGHGAVATHAGSFLFLFFFLFLFLSLLFLLLLLVILFLFFYFFIYVNDSEKVHG